MSEKDSNTKKLSKSISEIIINNKTLGYGFMIYFPINVNNRHLYGLLTSNEILPNEYLNDGISIRLKFINSTEVYDYTISKDTFVFACPFINLSFLEIPFGLFKNIEYLKINEKIDEDQSIISCHIDVKGKFIFCEGDISGLYGTYILYNIEESYENNVLCSPLLYLAENSNYQVIGVNQNNSLYKDEEENTYKKSLNINIILTAIKTLAEQKIKKTEKYLFPAKRLNLEQIHKLPDNLKETENQNIFISPGSQDYTSLFFYRTQYAWFWTPETIKDLNNMEEIRNFNWSLIRKDYPIKAIGGIYDGREPAPINVEIIKKLADSELSFLI